MVEVLAVMMIQAKQFTQAASGDVQRTLAAV